MKLKTTKTAYWPYVLIKGHTDDASTGACAMAAVSWLMHGKHSDRPECACPVLTSFIIPANDAMPADVRQRFLPYLHRIAGSRSEEHEAARTRILWLAAVRIFAPIALDQSGLHTEAEKLRALPDDVSAAKAETAAWAAETAAETAATAAAKAVATKAVAKAAWAAETAAKAAETAAWAAETAAETAATAAKTAAWAAGTAGTAGTAAKAKAAWAAAETAAETAAKAAAKAARHANTVWDAYFAVLDEALSAGPQGEPWSADVMERAIADHPMTSR
jgi:hypothetical protein